MTYKEQLAKAKKADKMKPLTVEIKTWKEVGEELIGKVIDVKPFEGSKFDTTCQKYIIETDDGLITTVFGGSVDKQFEGVNLIGKVIYAVYKGKGDLDDGRKFNRFEVLEI